MIRLLKIIGLILLAAIIGSSIFLTTNYFYPKKFLRPHILWQHKADSYFDYNYSFRQHPYNNNLVYFTDKGLLYGADLKTGQEKWSYSLPKKLLYISVSDNNVYLYKDISIPIAGYPAAKQLVALDALSGKEKWSLIIDNLSIVGTFNGIVYYSAGDYQTTGGQIYLFAANEDTGKELWRKSLGVGVRHGLVLDSGIYIIDDANVLRVLDLNSEQEKWSLQLRGAETISNLNVSDGNIKLDNGTLIDANTGQIFSRGSPSTNLIDKIVTPEITVFTTNAGSFCIDSCSYVLKVKDTKTGSLKWEWDHVFIFFENNGIVYFTSQDSNGQGFIYAAN